MRLARKQLVIEYYLAINCIAKIFDFLMMRIRGSWSRFYLTALSVVGYQENGLIELFLENNRYQYVLNFSTFKCNFNIKIQPRITLRLPKSVCVAA